MDLTGQRRVPYVDAGRGLNTGQQPVWHDTRPMVTIPPPEPVIGFTPPGLEYANDPMIQSIIEEHQRRQRTRIPIHPLDMLMQNDELKGRR